MRPVFPAHAGLSRRAWSSSICALAALSSTAGVTAPTASAAPRTDGVERGVVTRVNAIRAHNGLKALRVDHKLAKAADAHSTDMVRADFFAHESSDGTPFAQRIDRYVKRKETGETLAYLSTKQRRKAARVVQMWMASPGHRAALLTPEFRRIGVAKRKGTIYGQRSAVFTADLATKR